jgi:hypothetical protein
MSEEKARKLAKEHGLFVLNNTSLKNWIFVRWDGDIIVEIAKATYLEVDLMPERIISDRIVKGLIEETWK